MVVQCCGKLEWIVITKNTNISPWIHIAYIIASKWPFAPPALNEKVLRNRLCSLLRPLVRNWLFSGSVHYFLWNFVWSWASIKLKNWRFRSFDENPILGHFGPKRAKNGPKSAFLPVCKNVYINFGWNLCQNVLRMVKNQIAPFVSPGKFSF